jgi:hypothetical protein
VLSSTKGQLLLLLLLLVVAVVQLLLVGLLVMAQLPGLCM